MIQRNIKKQSGYIALTTMLVILAVTLTIGVAVSLMSISDLQLSLSEKRSSSSLNLVETCVEDVLLYLNGYKALPASVTLPDGSCTVTQDDHSGHSWTFTVDAQLEGYHKSVQVTVTRYTTMVVQSWKEL